LILQTNLMELKGKFYIKQSLKGDLDAGPKAKADTYKTLNELGFKPIIYYSDATSRLNRYCQGLMLVLKTLVISNSLVLSENPIKNWHFAIFANKIMRLRGNHLILLVHDVEGERYDFFDRRVEDSYMNTFDSIIAHNNIMRSFLSERLRPGIHFYTLNVFDYLVENGFIAQHDPIFRANWQIIYCGNLTRIKSKFIYDLPEIKSNNWTLNLYGLGLEQIDLGKMVRYQGSFSPNTPYVIPQAKFGLVWDGESVATCNGIYGDYLRMNNPHKMSLYFAIGLPLIVWENAAVAQLVTQYNLGFTIRSLHDIEDKLAHLTEIDFETYKQNVEIFTRKVTSGKFLALSLEQVTSATNN
jgi:hypothetical protein